jgi:hypothetical protein
MVIRVNNRFPHRFITETRLNLTVTRVLGYKLVRFAHDWNVGILE